VSTNDLGLPPWSRALKCYPSFMGLFSKLVPRKPPSYFWSWVQSPEGQKAISALASRSPGSQRAVAKIGDALRKVHPQLVWGYYPNGGHFPGCLEISADGMKALIPVVQEVVNTAPQMDNLTVVAFRQPSAGFGLAFSNGSNEVSIDSTLAVSRERSDGLYDFEVFVPVPAGTPQREVDQLGFMILDHALGEYAVMTKLGGIACRLGVLAPQGAIPMSEIAKSFAGAAPDANCG
jgi:hypothetical protein